MIIRAEHEFRTDKSGQPIELDFNAEAWKRLKPIKHDGATYPKAGWRIKSGGQIAEKSFVPKEAQKVSPKSIDEMSGKDLNKLIKDKKLDVNPAQPLPELRAAVKAALNPKEEDNE